MDFVTDLVSVIIPVYNVEKHLKQCIDSVINQTYKDLEIILIDDGSPDKSGEICDDYAEKDSRIIVVHKENGGVSTARNVGLDCASGNWIYFMDSDDWLDNNSIELALNSALSNNAEVVFFDYYHNETKVKLNFCSKSEILFINDRDDYSSFCEYLKSGYTIWNALFSASIINKIRFKTNIGYSDDRIFKFEVFSFIEKYVYLPMPLYHYRITPGSYTNTYRDSKLAELKNSFQIMDEIVSKNTYPKEIYLYINAFKISCIFAATIQMFLPGCKYRLSKMVKAVKSIVNRDEYKDVLNMPYDRSLLINTAKLYLKLFKTFRPVFIVLICCINHIFNRFKHFISR